MGKTSAAQFIVFRENRKTEQREILREKWVTKNSRKIAGKTAKFDPILTKIDFKMVQFCQVNEITFEFCHQFEMIFKYWLELNGYQISLLLQSVSLVSRKIVTSEPSFFDCCIWKRKSVWFFEISTYACTMIMLHYKVCFPRCVDLELHYLIWNEILMRQIVGISYGEFLMKLVHFSWNHSMYKYIVAYKNNFSWIFRFSRKTGPFFSFFAKNFKHEKCATLGKTSGYSASKILISIFLSRTIN